MPQPPAAAENALNAEADELAVQAEVLAFLAEQRHQVAVDELVRDLAQPSYGPFDRDAVERAARDLVRAGLLHRHGDFVFPTLAASHYQRLPHG